MEINKTLEIEFVKDTNYRRIYASGFWGGINSSGDLFLEIFEDVMRNPQALKVSPDGIEERVGDSDIVKVDRILHMGITLPINSVPTIIKWLQGKLEQRVQVKEIISQLSQNKSD